VWLPVARANLPVLSPESGRSSSPTPKGGRAIGEALRSRSRSRSFRDLSRRPRTLSCACFRRVRISGGTTPSPGFASSRRTLPYIPRLCWSVRGFGGQEADFARSPGIGRSVPGARFREGDVSAREEGSASDPGTLSSVPRLCRNARGFSPPRMDSVPSPATLPVIPGIDAGGTPIVRRAVRLGRGVTGLGRRAVRLRERTVHCARRTVRLRRRVARLGN